MSKVCRKSRARKLHDQFIYYPLLISALSVSAAIFIILEMSHPLNGMIKVSSAPMRTALEHLGQ